MILMWLGSLVIMAFGLSQSQKGWADIFSRWQKEVYEGSASGGLMSLLIRAALLVFTDASPQKSLYTATALYNLRVTPLRFSVLTIALSPLGGWWLLIMLALALNFNGYFILGVCVVGGLRYFLSSRFERSLPVLLGSGLFLIGTEATLRNSTVVQTLLGQTDLAFALADGRLGPVLALVGLALFLGLWMRHEVWALVVALALLASGSLSFNGALGVILGAKLAENVLFWWRARALDKPAQKLGREFALFSTIGLVIGFILAAEMRVFLNWGFTTELSAVQEKSVQFAQCIALIYFTQCLVLMVWGHWAGNRTLEELEAAKYFPSVWLQEDLLSPGARQWAKDKVQKRLSEIRYHLAGLDSLKEGQIPHTMQSRLRDEEQQLSALHL